jgi:hypothetical protein
MSFVYTAFLIIAAYIGWKWLVRYCVGVFGPHTSRSGKTQLHQARLIEADETRTVGASSDDVLVAVMGESIVVNEHNTKFKLSRGDRIGKKYLHSTSYRRQEVHCWEDFGIRFVLKIDFVVFED